MEWSELEGKRMGYSGRKIKLLISRCGKKWEGIRGRETGGESEKELSD